MRKSMSSKGHGALLTANVDRYFVFILDLPVSQLCKNNALNFLLIEINYGKNTVRYTEDLVI